MAIANQDQVLAFARWATTAFGGYAVGRGWISSDQSVLLGGFVTAAVPLVWSLFAHSNEARALSAAALPGVKLNVETDVAPASVAKLAEDPRVQNIDVAR
jgi:hypothetical protein